MNVFRRITWRAVLLTQSLAFCFAVAPWLENGGQSSQPNLPMALVKQSIPAFLIMMAAYAGDELVRRGWSLPRAFAATLLVACGVAAFAESSLGLAPLGLLMSFMNVAAYWGTALLVYLNRQSAMRLLEIVRSGELRRVQAERLLVESGLAAAQARINPAALLQQLAQVRALYAQGSDDAPDKLDLLIESLRETVRKVAPA